MIRATVSWVHEPAAASRRILHVNTSARGGGVAEILGDVMDEPAYEGATHGWLLLGGPPEFYQFTKLLHHRFHGHGAGEPLTAGTAVYRRVLADAAEHLRALVAADDVLVLHDPQTLGLAPLLAEHVGHLAWHCHIGTSTDPGGARNALWELFADDLDAVDTILVADPTYLPREHRHHVTTAAPAISLRAPKNEPLTDRQVREVLGDLGLTSTPGRAGIARVWQGGLLPDAAETVLQVSRWDPLKGMASVLALADSLPDRAHVVLAGPDPAEVLDDPEGLEQLQRVLAAFDGLPETTQERVHVVALSLEDRTVNARAVNALQRRADVVVQRSLEEGFGLTVTEAMLKARPVVAHAVGGIRQQIVDGQNGHLVDAADDERFAALVRELLTSPSRRESLGRAARESVEQNFLIGRLVRDYTRLARRRRVGTT